ELGLVFTFLEDYYRPQVAEHGVALTWRIATLLSGGRCPLHEVRFMHRAVAPMRTYRARFDAPIIFGANDVALVVSADGLEVPISENIEELRNIATRYLEGRQPRERAGITVRVRSALEALLGTGASGQRELARTLHLHPRTLQRRLREAGTTFEAIKDEVRRDLAQRYLSNPDLPLNQITVLLDYSEQSALGRSCRRWFDATPQQIRARLSCNSMDGSDL
ncbi:MAG TPA: helix-turn-helix domain-containing protein, partial [Acidimicrobiales bacterium]|nr:helix-turn-helix domain-containing protein [Acidimicrobiales bacterium]